MILIFKESEGSLEVLEVPLPSPPSSSSSEEHHNTREQLQNPPIRRVHFFIVHVFFAFYGSSCFSFVCSFFGEGIFSFHFVMLSIVPCHFLMFFLFSTFSMFMFFLCFVLLFVLPLVFFVFAFLFLFPFPFFLPACRASSGTATAIHSCGEKTSKMHLITLHKAYLMKNFCKNST